MDIEQEKYFVIQGMRTYGGSFVKSLGDALLHADRVNSQLIKDTWPEEWKKYFEWGQKIEKKNG